MIPSVGHRGRFMIYEYANLEDVITKREIDHRLGSAR